MLIIIYQIWLGLECKPNISTQNCDHIGFYGKYGQKLPAIIITVAYGLHKQPLSMS